MYFVVVDSMVLHTWHNTYIHTTKCWPSFLAHCVHVLPRKCHKQGHANFRVQALRCCNRHFVSATQLLLPPLQSACAITYTVGVHVVFVPFVFILVEPQLALRTLQIPRGCIVYAKLKQALAILSGGPGIEGFCSTL